MPAIRNTELSLHFRIGNITYPSYKYRRDFNRIIFFFERNSTWKSELSIRTPPILWGKNIPSMNASFVTRMCETFRILYTHTIKLNAHRKHANACFLRIITQYYQVKVLCILYFKNVADSLISYLNNTYWKLYYCIIICSM